MPQDETEEILARLLHYERELEAEKKVNRIYQAQLRHAREQKSEEYQREIERGLKLQQIYLGYEHISTYRFKRLVARSNYQFKVRTKSAEETPAYCKSCARGRIARRNKATSWQQLQGLLRRLTRVLMTIPRDLTRLCMTKIRKAKCSTTQRISRQHTW